MPRIPVPNCPKTAKKQSVDKRRVMRRLSASAIIGGLCTRGSASEPVNQRHGEPAYAIYQQDSDESEHHGVDVKLSYAQRILKQLYRRDKSERDDEADFSAFFTRP